MIVGTVVGVAQTNVKRMLAYSSIAHAGYLLLGLVVGEQDRQGRDSVLPAAYAVTNLGAFGVMAVLGTPRREQDEVRDFAGLSKRGPGWRR